jgi:hypothetical protein
MTDAPPTAASPPQRRPTFDEAPVRRRAVTTVIGILLYFVEDELLPRFAEFF